MGEQLRRLLATGAVQDAGEIALAAGLISAAQLAAGTDPSAVAGSALLGAGVSIPARPLAAGMGRGIGRAIDATQARYGQPPEVLQKIYGGVTQAIPGTNANVQRYMNHGTLNTLPGQMSLGRYDANHFATDGSRYGTMEGDIGSLARTGGDNVAQALVQLLAPGLAANGQVPGE